MKEKKVVSLDKDSKKYLQVLDNINRILKDGKSQLSNVIIPEVYTKEDFGAISPVANNIPEYYKKLEKAFITLYRGNLSDEEYRRLYKELRDSCEDISMNLGMVNKELRGSCQNISMNLGMVNKEIFINFNVDSSTSTEEFTKALENIMKNIPENVNKIDSGKIHININMKSGEKENLINPNSAENRKIFSGIFNVGAHLAFLALIYFVTSGIVGGIFGTMASPINSLPGIGDDIVNAISSAPIIGYIDEFISIISTLYIYSTFKSIIQGITNILETLFEKIYRNLIKPTLKSAKNFLADIYAKLKQIISDLINKIKSVSKKALSKD